MKGNNQRYSTFKDKFISGKKDEKSEKYDVLVHSLENEETIKIRLRLLLFVNQSHFTTSNLIKSEDFEEVLVGFKIHFPFVESGIYKSEHSVHLY